MQLQLGTTVERLDGTNLGELVRLVFDPATQRVPYIIVDHNALDGREIQVPAEVIQSADDDSALLDVTDEQFAAFGDFEHSRNLAPPPDAAEVTSDLVHDPADVPDVPPVGAATGVESIAFTPILEEDYEVPLDAQLVDGDTVVWATDGEIGRFKGFWLDDGDRTVQSLLVQRGVVFTHSDLVPMDLVESVQREAIVLSVPKAAVENLYVNSENEA